MSNRIKVQTESYASDAVIDEVLAEARAQDSSAGVVNVVRDSGGKVVEVELALPNSDSNGATAAANAIASNPGVAKSVGFPKAISSNFNGSISAYQGLYTDGVAPGDVGLSVLDSNSNCQLLGLSSKGDLNTLNTGNADFVVARAAGLLWGAPSGNALMMIAPFSNSEVLNNELESVGLMLHQPQTISTITGFEFKMTLTRETGTISYSQDTSGTAADMFVEEYRADMPAFQSPWSGIEAIARYQQSDANWIVGGEDSGVSKDSPLTIKVTLQQGQLRFFANGSEMLTAAYNTSITPSNLLIRHQLYMYSNGGSLYHKPVKIDDVSFSITSGSV